MKNNKNNIIFLITVFFQIIFLSFDSQIDAQVFRAQKLQPNYIIAFPENTVITFPPGVDMVDLNIGGLQITFPNGGTITAEFPAGMSVSFPNPEARPPVNLDRASGLTISFPAGTTVQFPRGKIKVLSNMKRRLTIKHSTNIKLPRTCKFSLLKQQRSM